jgi:hypothetical protein
MKIQVKMTRAENLDKYGVKAGTPVTIDLEEYLRGVVPAEVYESRTPVEALKAQAIAARTFAARKHLDGTVMDDTANYQAYRSSRAEGSPRSAQAIQDTGGMVLTYGGEVIRAYYSNSNGGETKRTDQVWSAKLPYYLNRPDPWDVAAREGKNIKASHGVGLSQVGAEYAASIGVSCEDILAFYYPGTVIGRIEMEEEAMANKTNIGLVRWALSWVGRRYWYGTCCYDCTKSLLDRKTTQYPSHYTAARRARYEKDIANKDKCADCIGLIKGYMWTDEATGKQSYGSNGCKDYGANGMRDAAKEKGTIATLPEIPGLILWKSGHVGVYIGGGEVVEAKGFAAGVVRGKVAGRGFTHWFKQPGMEYVGEADATAPADVYALLGERTLRKGTTGEDVRQLQLALASLNYACGAADGIFGAKTLAAVKAFQGDHELVTDGIYGPLTHTALVDAIQGPEETENDAEEMPVPGSGVTVTGSTLNVRVGAGTQYAIATTVKKGDVLPLPDTTGWVPVLYNGAICWVSEKYIKR